jgi:predicted SAM-dependent methyltransferase
MKLHLGCFDQPTPGWVNTDVTPHIFVSRVPGAATLLYRMGKLTRERFEQHKQGLFAQLRYLDVSRRFPFASGSVEAVFSCHLLEHLTPDVAMNCLRESFRILCTGGIIRVGVPDLDLLVRQYDPTSPDDFVYRVFESRQVRDKNRHHWMYNDRSLAGALAAAGFIAAKRWEYRTGNCPDLELLDNRPDVTLFMEASHP